MTRGIVSGLISDYSKRFTGSCSKICFSTTAITKLGEELQEIDIGFNDPREVYYQKSTLDLVRAFGVFNACRIPLLVKNADSLINLGKFVTGKYLVNTMVRKTFFDHFCAGETLSEVEQRLQHLNGHGVGGILDYGAEDDVGSATGAMSRSTHEHTDTVVARTYDYEGELKCDALVDVFRKSILAAELQQGQGFAAIKVTALGNPELLKRVSLALSSIKNLFARFDRNADGFISKDEFEIVYQELFGETSKTDLNSFFKKWDLLHNGYVDYVAFTEALNLSEMPALLQKRKETHPTDFDVVLTEEELKLVEAMISRVGKLAKLAADKNVKLMVDAEHSYFQPAIDHTVAQLQRQYNKQKAVIFNTYQCYLKDSFDRVTQDIERARRENYFFAAKLVRGAYMVLERRHAAEMGYPSPIHETLEDTHRNYNQVLEVTLKEVKESGGKAEIMVASHNQQSIELAIGLMKKLDLTPGISGVFFGQLLGMADHLTYTLGRKGYRAYKYVTFGPVEEVIPYLVRRAQENSGMMSGAQFELNLIKNELWRRAVTDSQMAQWATFATDYYKKIMPHSSANK